MHIWDYGAFSSAPCWVAWWVFIETLPNCCQTALLCISDAASEPRLVQTYTGLHQGCWLISAALKPSCSCSYHHWNCGWWLHGQSLASQQWEDLLRITADWTVSF